MISDRHSLPDTPLRENRHLASVRLHLLARKPGFGIERRGANTLDRARSFAVDDAGGLGRNEEIHLGANAVLFPFDVTVEQKARDPAAAHGNAKPGEYRAEFLHIQGEAPSGFHSRKAGAGRLAEALLKAHVIGQRREIVVPPGNGGNSEFRFHGPSHSDTLLRADLVLLLARGLNRLA